MHTDLHHYIKIYNVIDKNTCDETIRQLENDAYFEHHKIYNNVNGVNTITSDTNELDSSLSAILNSKIIMEMKRSCLLRYIKDLNFEWFPWIHAFQGVEWHRYFTGRHTINHADLIYSLFASQEEIDANQRRGVPVLSVISLLNDIFDGGELVMFNDQVIPMKQGDVVVFPSTFLYPHKVNMVTNGTRYSAVSWAW